MFFLIDFKWYTGKVNLNLLHKPMFYAGLPQSFYYYNEEGSVKYRVCVTIAYW